MTPRAPTTFLSGAVEGFYGQPWTASERLQLFDWMAAWGLNTYFYAPKDDLHHRALWREPYSALDAEPLRLLARACRERGLRFVYALSPGLDIQYSREAELTRLHERFEQMFALGCDDVALLFDDIPDAMDASDLERLGSLASAQCHVANALFAWTRERRPSSRFMFCPTAYCERMAAARLGGDGYLETLGRELLPAIDVLWTGPEIVSREITVAHVQAMQAVLCRKPIIWDNLHANDYDGRRFFCGPYSGRQPELIGEISGLLSNPNTEFPLNYVPLRTLARFVTGSGPWDPRGAYLAAMGEWAPSFTTIRGSLSLEDVILFGDCYYLPYEEGPEAEALYRDACAMVNRADASAAAAFRGRAARLRALCGAMTELRNRSLFHSLSRRTWDLREELDLLERFAARGAEEIRNGSAMTSDFHLPGTYRGGLVARLQQLLVQRQDGAFSRAVERTAADVGTATVHTT
jgi:protein O-GlcNAcase / histone acetyltransferase